MAADCLRLPIFLLEATNTSNQLGTKFNDWKCFFVRFKHRISDWWVHDLLQKQRAASKDVGELRAHAAPLWKMVQWWVEYHSGWSSNGECSSFRFIRISVKPFSRTKSRSSSDGFVWDQPYFSLCSTDSPRASAAALKRLLWYVPPLLVSWMQFRRNSCTWWQWKHYASDYCGCIRCRRWLWRQGIIGVSIKPNKHKLRSAIKDVLIIYDCVNAE